MEEGQREREEMQDIRTMMRYCARKKKTKRERLAGSRRGEVMGPSREIGWRLRLNHLPTRGCRDSRSKRFEVRVGHCGVESDFSCGGEDS